MKKYTATKRITLTVEPGSVVIVSDTQYKLAKAALEPVDVAKAAKTIKASGK